MAEKSDVVCKIFKQRYQQLTEERKVLHFELDVTNKNIESKNLEIISSIKIFSTLEISMEERRKICTTNDEKFRLKKEEIDSILGMFDKEFNNRLNEFKLIPSKKYQEEVEKFPPGLCDFLLDLLRDLGFNISKSLIKKQIELIRVLEDSISSVIYI